MQSSIRAFIAIEIDEAARAKLVAIQEELGKAGGHVSWVKPQNIHATLVFLGDIFPEMVEPVAAAMNQAAVGMKPLEVEIRGLGYFGSPRSPFFARKPCGSRPSQPEALLRRSRLPEGGSSIAPSQKWQDKMVFLASQGSAKIPRPDLFESGPRVASPRVIWAGMTGAVEPLAGLQGRIVAAVMAIGIKPDTKLFKPHLTIGRVRSGRNAAALVGAIEAGRDEFFGKLVVRRVVLIKSVLEPQGPEYSLLQAAILSPSAGSGS